MDYLPVTTGVLQVPPGSTITVWFIFLSDNTGLEGDETFTGSLELSSSRPLGYFFQATLSATITDRNGKSCHNLSISGSITTNAHEKVFSVGAGDQL